MYNFALSLVFVFLVIIPFNAHANAGVPMLALAWPIQWLALIPIVLIECEVLRQSLKISFTKLLWPVGKANLISTLVGIPIAWIGMLIPLFVLGYGASLLPTSTEIPDYVYWLLTPLMAAWTTGESAWQIYLAFVFLTVPFCVISIYIEKHVLLRSLSDQYHDEIYSAVVKANILSYILLSVFALAFPLTR